MKTFFGEEFIEKRVLKEAGIDYPIKLQYYKNINEDKVVENNRLKYGVEITKTEYKAEGTKVERKKVKYITNNENTVNQLLHILKDNLVTPICLNEIVWEYKKQIL